ncbi:MAG: fumarylacetoacetate hydrolase [Ignavibacteria bacterium RBG_13_36_8]|nr:MAG: fumarylacetoacetate hydrolase [Ignavibacteria bacterium RBG_13_36_8]
MILSTVKTDSGTTAHIHLRNGLVPVQLLNESFHLNFPTDLFSLIQSGRIKELQDWLGSIDQSQLIVIPIDKSKYEPLYRQPRKIWGIGLNYKEHAADLNEVSPTDEPASYMRPDTTIIGYGDEIQIPLQSNNVTAEAELGIIIGKKCKNVERENWLDVVAGFTTILDMTEVDVLKKNPRFLTRSKCYDTFFSFGPTLVTPDEIEDVMKLKIATIINGKVQAENVVSNMTFPPDYLVSFHSKVMTFLPGDIISTGTPGATPIKHGDTVECRITGFYPLINNVVDLKTAISF